MPLLYMWEMGGEFHSGLSVFVSVCSDVCDCLLTDNRIYTDLWWWDCGFHVSSSVLCSAATGCHPVQVQPTVVVTKTERLITQFESNLFSCYVSISERC